MSIEVVIITDGWEPYFSGVITTLKHTSAYLTGQNVSNLIVHPRLFPGSFISLKEFDFVYRPSTKRLLEQMLGDYDPAFIHISTEGPLGVLARNICLARGWKFTTAYHTKFPEYLHQRIPFMNSERAYKYFRWFHKPSARVMVATHSLGQLLRYNEFDNQFGIWTRGVDTDLFHPKWRDPTFSEPYALYVGRVATEKNIEEFLEAKTSLTKVVVGDGPIRPALQRKYKRDAVFLGKKSGEELAKFYANADVFCFPSTTDTFGLVQIESLSSGTPVAVKPESASIVWGDVAAIRENMSHAINSARYLDRSKCRPFVLERYTWDIAGYQFCDNLVPK